MKKIVRHVGTRSTAQRHPIPGREADMTQNYAGAYAFKADKWTRLNRFLILGSEGGTYYAGERQVTLDNIEAVRSCVKEDGQRVVRELVDISMTGRAPKNDQAILVLAYCLKYMGDGLDDRKALAIRKLAAEAVPKVCRIGTHLFQLAEAIEAFGGWGPLTRRVISNWYNNRSPDAVAFQAVKYQQRDNWSHSDLIRLSHVISNAEDKSLLSDHAKLYGWILDHSKVDSIELPQIIFGFEQVRVAGLAPGQVAKLIGDYRLPREAIPTHYLNEKVVWEALLVGMPMTAMIKNLGNMSNVGLLDPMSQWTRQVVDQLGNVERIRKARVHPINILAALKTYAQGHGVKGSLTWSPNQRIVDALDDAFYSAFDNIEPINKRVLVAIDKSGSMQYSVSNTIFSAVEAAAVMAMVTVRKAQEYWVIGYDSEVRELNISPRQRLDDILKTLPHDGGATDASQPILWAHQRKVKFDAMCYYSDGESWAGQIHAAQAMEAYRRTAGLNTLLCTCDIVPNMTQLTDNLDSRSMHCSGFDEQTPALIQEFIRSN
jgi:60 kDa SS-A/Ro ribonucleoprotein